MTTALPPHDPAKRKEEQVLRASTTDSRPTKKTKRESKKDGSPSAAAASTGGALTIFEVAKSRQSANRGVAQKHIHVDCTNLWLLEMFTETYRKGQDPNFDPGHMSFWNVSETSENL